MNLSPIAQADLFDDADEDHGPSLRQAWARQEPPRRRRLRRAFDPEGAAQILNEHDDYRVLRRLKPRPVDPAYWPGSGESVALVVDVETTGLDHRRDEVIELGMVAFVHDAEGRIGPVVGVLSMLHEPTVEISAEITRLSVTTIRNMEKAGAGPIAGRSANVQAVQRAMEGEGIEFLNHGAPGVRLRKAEL